MAIRRKLSEASPDYIALLDRLEASTGLEADLIGALADLESSRMEEAASDLVHEVVVAALSASMAPDLPARREASDKRFQELFAALQLLGKYFGVERFPQVPEPVIQPALDSLEPEVELRRALAVHQVALGIIEADSEDERSVTEVAALRYGAEEAPAALVKMFQHLLSRRNATLGSLTAPSLGRNQLTDVEDRSFGLLLARRMEILPKGAHVGFITAVTNALFDLEGEGGISKDAVRKRLDRASTR